MKLSKNIIKTNVLDEFIDKFGIDMRKYKNLKIIDNEIVSIETTNQSIIDYVKLKGLKKGK